MKTKTQLFLVVAYVMSSMAYADGTHSHKRKEISAIPAAAQEVTKKETSWYDKITIGGELRERTEAQINYAPLTGGVDNDAFVLLRARLNFEARPVDGVKIFIQPQFSRAFAQEESTVAGNTDVANPNNVFDLHQGYLAFPEIAGGPFSVTLGRQELSYGDERLIGAFGWSNVGRSFDAAKVRWSGDKKWVDGFFAWNEKAAGNEYFGGLYSQWQLKGDMVLEPYALLLRENGTDFTTAGVVAAPETTLGTFGIRWAGTCDDKRIDYGIEGTVQAGKVNPNTQLSYAAHAAAGYTWTDSRWAPRVGLEYNFASGDDPSTSKVERFNNLFPTNHDKYGYIDFVSWRNIHDISPSVSIKPNEESSIQLAYHLFMLPQSGDAFFRATGAVLRTGAAGASHLGGHEVDLLGKYKFNKWLNGVAGYSIFKGGSFFSDTGTNGTAHFGYGQLTASF